MDMEQVIMKLISSSGDARSKALEAIQSARNHDFEEAEKLLVECEEGLTEAHRVQTDLLVKEASGDHTEVRLLMVHAQDHMMNALTVKDLAEQIVLILKEYNEK